MELLHFSTFAEGLGLTSCFIATRLLLRSGPHFLPAVTLLQRGRIWAGSSAAALLIAGCTWDAQGIEHLRIVPRELEELLPPT